jgi:hypothetical protein
MTFRLRLLPNKKTAQRPSLYLAFRNWDQQPRHMFFTAASVRAFSALSGSTNFPGSDAGCVLDVADLPGAMGADILS